MIEVTRPAWHRDASCRGVDPAKFFPERGRTSLVAISREFCSGCPVSAECAAAGLALPQALDHGLWGGLSVTDRRDARRRVGLGRYQAEAPEPRAPMPADPAVPVASEARRGDLVDLLAGDDPASITDEDIDVLADVLDIDVDRIKKDLRVLRQDAIRARAGGGLPNINGRIVHQHHLHLETA